LKRTIEEGFELLASSPQARELLHAAATGCDEAAQRVLLREANAEDTRWRRSCDHSGDTALLLAARGGYRAIAQLLVANAADLNWQNQYGYSALHAACDRGNAEIVELLCISGADPRLGERTANEAPGLTAVRRHAQMLQQEPAALQVCPQHLERHKACITLCLAAMSQWDPGALAAASLVNSMGVTGLHVAAEWSDIEVCQVLLQYKAFVEARDSVEGASPLMYALRAGATLETCKLLLRAKADPRGRDRHNGTPLHFTVGLGDAGLYHCAMILSVHADANSLDEKGASALALAALRGAPTVVRELLTAGACPRVCKEMLPFMSEDDEGQAACRKILEAVM
jgi:ankyrin repeat protein